MAKWDSAYVNDLPDSAFAWIDPKYKSDESDDKSLRKLPYKDADGEVDLPHVRNALARLNGTDGPSDAEKATIRKKLEGLLESTKERDSKLLRKVIMTAPDTIYWQTNNGDGSVTQTTGKRTPEQVKAIFENSKARLHQEDGATWPIPIMREHEAEGYLPLGAVVDLTLVDIPGGRIGIEAAMELEDEAIAERLQRGTLWTSPAIIYGGMLGVDDKMGDYLEELSIVTSPASRDYRAREMMSARKYHLAPERIIRGGDDMEELMKVTAERDTLVKDRDAVVAERDKLKADLAEAQAKMHVESVKAYREELAKKGLVAGEIDELANLYEADPTSREVIDRLVDKLSARLPKVEPPVTSTVPGVPPATAEEKDAKLRTLVVDTFSPKKD